MQSNPTVPTVPTVPTPDNEGVTDILAQTPSLFQFSGVDPASLSQTGASKFTLVTLVIDTSGSVQEFEKTIEALAKELVQTCKKNPASDSLMLRVVTFNNDVNEVHGFKLIGSITPDDYTGKFVCGGSTALYDAMANATEASTTYAATLVQSFFLCNAISFVITDGEENASRITPRAQQVADAAKAAVHSERLESNEVILLGLTDQPSFGTYLTRVRDECKCSKSMVIGKFSVGGPDVNAAKIAKLVGFISASVSSTSQACGKGGPSQAIPASLTI